MSTPNQPDDKNVERGALTPPWKRGEQSAATGLTAGEMAKAAGVAGDDRVGGPPPRGVVSSSGPRPESTSSSEPSSTPPKPSVSSAPPSPTGSTGSGSSGPQPTHGPSNPAPQPAPKPQPATPASTGPASGPIPTQPQTKPPSSQPVKPAVAPAAQAKPQSANQSATKPQGNQPHGKPAPFVESETRNIPREQLVSKDQLPDLDSIHHTEQAKEQALARAASQTIPARASSSVPLRAAVQIRRVDPWSVFKVAGVLCIAGFFIWMIAVAILYGVLGGMGIWDQINSSFGTIVNGDGSTSGQDLISGGQVFMFSALFGIASAVLLTALATISAYIYNVCADFVGGVEVTLADLD